MEKVEHASCIVETKEVNALIRVLCEKLRVAQLTKKFPIFYGNITFSGVFTRPYPELKEFSPNPEFPISLRCTIF